MDLCRDVRGGDSREKKGEIDCREKGPTSGETLSESEGEWERANYIWKG